MGAVSCFFVFSNESIFFLGQTSIVPFVVLLKCARVYVSLAMQLELFATTLEGPWN
jgi:hypothetical protein